MPTTAFPQRALLLLLLLTILWGTNWPLFPLAMREVSVWSFRSVSVLGAAAILLAVARARGQSLTVPRALWPTLVIASLSNLLIWNIATAYASILIPSGQASMLAYTMPLWSALISVLLLGERLTARLAFALVLGAAGVGLLMAPNFQSYAKAPAGVVLGLLAGLGWAVGTLVLKRRAITVPVTVFTGWQLLVCGVPILLVTLAQSGHTWTLPSAASIAVIAYITIVPMALGNVLWFSIVGLLPASVAGLSAIMVPVVAMVTGAWMHGEPLGPREWLAMALSVAALWLAVFKPAQRA